MSIAHRLGSLASHNKQSIVPRRPICANKIYLPPISRRLYATTPLEDKGNAQSTNSVNQPNTTTAVADALLGLLSRGNTKPTSRANQITDPSIANMFGDGTSRRNELPSRGRQPQGQSAASGMSNEPHEDGSYIVFVVANRNNTVCTFTDPAGKPITVSSAGQIKGVRKAARGTSDAGYQSVMRLTERVAQLPSEKKGNEKAKIYHGLNIQQQVMETGVHLKLKGFGPGRDQAFRAILAAGWRLNRVTDVTGVRHGGCRPRKKRRL